MANSHSFLLYQRMVWIILNRGGAFVERKCEMKKEIYKKVDKK